MASGVRKLSNLILYSSLWIALCAAAQVQLTYDLVFIDAGLDGYTLFVLSSTLVLYSVHRLVGMRRVQAFAHLGRFAVIRQYRSHILFYGVCAAIAAVALAFQLPLRTWIFLCLPVAISAAYVLPVKPGGLRLRDIPLIKIFLIAASWSLITTTVPLLHQHYTGNHLAMIFAERFLFVVAITIPFDIRDYPVDQQSRLTTLPHVMGIRASKLLALILLGLSFVSVLILCRTGAYDVRYLLPAGAVYMLTAALIAGARPEMDDHYYSGLLDGVLFLLPFLLWVWTDLLGDQ
ncbi:MAG: hypothetical protein R3301_08435 [Saprospiraceae bacterium]|nr:hypothetical protein [Saprospiraceae bacterium]